MQQVPENFGNYTIKGIEELHFPEPVSWWPQTAGWYLVGGFLLLAALWFAYKRLRAWRRDRYRRGALQALKALEATLGDDAAAALAPLPALIKRAALEAYPRTDVASLSGEAWIEFLNRDLTGARFDGRFSLVAYGPRDRWPVGDDDTAALFAATRHWLRNHRRPADD